MNATSDRAEAGAQAGAQAGGQGAVQGGGPIAPHRWHVLPWIQRSEGGWEAAGELTSEV